MQTAAQYNVEYKTIASAATYYAREYVQFSALPASGTQFRSFMNMQSSSPAYYKVSAGLRYNSTAAKWCLAYNSGGAASYQYGGTPNVNTWYCVEVKAVVAGGGGGSVEMWVDGVSVLSAAGLTNNGDGNITLIVIGNDYWSETGYSVTSYHDCVVVDTNYIGVESTAVSVNKGGSLGGIMANMIGSKMFFSAVNRFPKLTPRTFNL